MGLPLKWVPVMSHGTPNVWVARNADERFRSSSPTSISFGPETRVSGETSMNRSPRWFHRTAFAVELNVNDGTATMEPGGIRMAASMAMSAESPDGNVSVGAPVAFASPFSNCSFHSPQFDSIRESIICFTTSAYSLWTPTGIVGCVTGMKSLRPSCIALHLPSLSALLRGPPQGRCVPADPAEHPVGPDPLPPIRQGPEVRVHEEREVERLSRSVRWERQILVDVVLLLERGEFQRVGIDIETGDADGVQDWADVGPCAAADERPGEERPAGATGLEREHGGGGHDRMLGLEEERAQAAPHGPFLPAVAFDDESLSGIERERGRIVLPDREKDRLCALRRSDTEKI